ncbi:MAG TPA: hypothetical protein VH914_00565 [Acidimicrobiia bacterium]|jgi:hypothetical protein|nr:hypothetical protein [Acidimicrobiia bacterium]
MTLTPNDAANCTLQQGSVIQITAEDMLVTSAITKTDSTHWTMTVTRAYSGVDTMTGTGNGGSNVKHGATAAGVICLPWSTADGVHPSDYGHALFAKIVLDTLATVPVTNRKIATSGAYYAHDQQSWPTPSSGVPGYFYPRCAAARSSTTATQSKEYAYPQRITRNGIITSLNSYIVTGAAGAALRWCVYTDEDGSPYQLILDTGVVGTVAGTSSSTLATASLILPVRRGLYWVSAIVQGSGSVSIRSTPTNFPGYDGYVVPDTNSGIQTTGEPSGKSRTGHHRRRDELGLHGRERRD